jgi:hypothetical protein
MGTKEYHRQYYLKNRERLRAQAAAYYRKNSDATLQLDRVRNRNRTPEEIERDKQYHKEWYKKNKAEHLANCKETYKQNAEKIVERVLKYRRSLPDEKRSLIFRNSVLRKFHTTEEWYQAKLAEQDGHCALCPRKVEENGNRLAIDHDHRCCAKSGSCGGCLRGILCRRCNVRLGYLDEFLSLGMVLENAHRGWFAKAVEYLKKYRGKDGRHADAVSGTSAGQAPIR